MGAECCTALSLVCRKTCVMGGSWAVGRGLGALRLGGPAPPELWYDVGGGDIMERVNSDGCCMFIGMPLSADNSVGMPKLKGGSLRPPPFKPPPLLPVLPRRENTSCMPGSAECCRSSMGLKLCRSGVSEGGWWPSPGEW